MIYIWKEDDDIAFGLFSKHTWMYNKDVKFSLMLLQNKFFSCSHWISTLHLFILLSFFTIFIQLFSHFYFLFIRTPKCIIEWISPTSFYRNSEWNDLTQMQARKELKYVSLCTQIYIKKKSHKINIFLTDHLVLRISTWSSI